MSRRRLQPAALREPNRWLAIRGPQQTPLEPAPSDSRGAFVEVIEPWVRPNQPWRAGNIAGSPTSAAVALVWVQSAGDTVSHQLTPSTEVPSKRRSSLPRATAEERLLGWEPCRSASLINAVIPTENCRGPDKRPLSLILSSRPRASARPRDLP